MDIFSFPGLLKCIFFSIFYDWNNHHNCNLNLLALNKTLNKESITVSAATFISSLLDFPGGLPETYQTIPQQLPLSIVKTKGLAEKQ